MTFPSPDDMFGQFEAQYVRKKEGKTLIIGSKVHPGRTDRRMVHTDAFGIDMAEGIGVDLVHDMEEPLPGMQFDHIECTSVLEHAKHPWKIAENIESLLNPGGTIFLTVPFVWRVHGYPNDYWRFTTACIRDVLFPFIEWTPIAYVSDRIWLPKEVRWPKEKNVYPSFMRMEVYGFGTKK